MPSNNKADRPLDHKNYYRLPWSLTDHVTAWLEVTKKCNMRCEGCFSFDDRTGHKTLQQIKEELEVIEKYRKIRTVEITGGEPLTHPQIKEVIQLISDKGYQPILITNGLDLTPQLLLRLKAAGLKIIMIHVDSWQNRPGWKGKNELELNELRLSYAKMVSEVKGIPCGFHTTVYENTLKYVPALLEWAERHIYLVEGMTFIAFRKFWEAKPKSQFQYFTKGKKVELALDMIYKNSGSMRGDITSREIVREIRKKYPDFEPCSYLGGTKEPDALKWLFTVRVGKKNEIYGYFGSKLAEVSQVFRHLLSGRYGGYNRPWFRKRAKLMFPLGLIDKGTAQTFKNYLKACLKNPLKLLAPVYFQIVLIIQPPDILEDGSQSMCDGCPDITAWNGHLVWSCRLEELKRYGCFLNLGPAEKGSQKKRSSN